MSYESELEITSDPTSYKYCNSLTSYSRFQTREVNIGDVPMGADNPIRIQSMTTTATLDTRGTIDQSIRIIEAGADYVRITAPNITEAGNLEAIKKGIRERGYTTPLIADIHFTPNAAELAARIVEKVRVNPGNYADKKKFAVREYSDAEYEDELDRIRSKFLPLIAICKEYGTAMRIGTNHGSLSDRIMNRYGDSPLGMVESALEFVRICQEENYREIVLSMKASNTIVMVQAYRLLVNKMMEYEMNYPIHIGVTEAGEAEDGRIKSSVGIGTLLEDGIGDTVRVSLTEEPEFEIPIAKALVARYTNREAHQKIESGSNYSLDPFVHARRHTVAVMGVGGNNVPRVVTDLEHYSQIDQSDLVGLGYTYLPDEDKWNISDMACDFIYAGNQLLPFDIPGTLSVIQDAAVWKASEKKERRYPLFCEMEYFDSSEKSAEINFIAVDINSLSEKFIELVKAEKTVVLLFETANAHGMAEQREMFIRLYKQKCDTPVLIKRNYESDSEQDLMLSAATDLGALLIDGMGDGVWLKNRQIDAEKINSTLFGILQATRTRISKTEYISCPSCGRTLFDLQETTARIRARTDHLKGVKIGIMGCIVNGPGEMADADYGYVGTGIDKITLYKGMEVVQRNVPAEGAVDALIELIKHHGDWVDV